MGIVTQLPGAFDKYRQRRVAPYAFFGMVYYTCNWFQQDGKITAAELGAIFLKIFTKGVFVDSKG